MYSWNTVRNTCAVLLLLPLVHLAFLVSRETLAALEASPEVWAGEMEAYAQADLEASQPPAPLVVVGGQRVKLWRGLADILAPTPVLMRGLGNATVDDIIFHYDRLISFYRPDTLVLLPGSSEFHIRDMKSAEELVSTIQALANIDARKSSTRRLYVFTPLKTPLYPGDNEKIDRAGQLLKSWAAADERVTILDANALLSKRDGRPGPAYYRNDGINLNEHGYLRLSLMLQAQVERDRAAYGAATVP